MNDFHISGRCELAPPCADWRDQLARLLGSKPRRIGNWAELGLYGALLCMADAGETSLPQDAHVMVTSRHGTRTATNAALAQMRTDLPMPLTFLQTQASQLLALLAAQMAWQGHACFFAGGRVHDLLRLAKAQTGEAGVLLGYVDEMNGGVTYWLRLRPNTSSGVTSRYDFSVALTRWMDLTAPGFPLGDAHETRKVE